MSKVIKNINISWNWTGDFYALQGFNVAITSSSNNPKNGVVIQSKAGADVTSYIFNHVTLDNTITYTAWVQAIYDGADSDWLSASNISVTDDGNATISTTVYTDIAKNSAISTASSDATTKANNAQSTAISTAQNYTDTNTMQDGISVGGVFTGSFVINQSWDGTANNGEIKVNTGKFIHPNGNEYTVTGSKEIATMVENLSASDWRYIAFVGSDFSRFTLDNTTVTSSQFVAIKFVNGVWKYDKNSGLVDFTPNSNDCIVAKIVGQTQINSIQMYSNTNVIAGTEATNIKSWQHSSDTTTINGGKIYTGTITADKIATGSITATNGIIASIDASKITTGTLDASRIASSSITVTKLDSTTQANIASGANALTSAKSYTDTSVSNIQIGGRNLLLNSSFDNGTNSWFINNTTYSTVVVNAYLGHSAMKINSSGLTTSTFYDVTQTVSNLLSDTQYSISFYCDNNCDVYFVEKKSDGSNTIIYKDNHHAITNSTGQFTKNSFTFTTQPDTAKGIFYYRVWGTNITQISMIKIEQGNKASDWTLSIEEINSAISMAQSDADIANSAIADMSSDDKVTPVEKVQLKKEWATISAEYPQYTSLATTFGITTENTNYTGSYNTLNTVLNGVGGILLSMTTTSTVVGTTFRGQFDDYYDKKAQLIKAINVKGKTLADTAQGTANTANTTANETKTTVDAWKSTDVTKIDGGKIYTGSITADKIAIGNWNNFSELTRNNLWGKFTASYDATYTNKTWYTMTTLQRDTQISRSYNCNGGESFRIKFDLTTTVQGASTNGGASDGYKYVNIGLYGKTKSNTNFWTIPTGGQNCISQSISVTATLPSDAVQFYIAVQIGGFSPFSGTVKISDVLVQQMNTGELVVDGSVSANAIYGGTLTLGGSSNVNGSLKINNASSQTIIKADKDVDGQYNIRAMDTSGNVRAKFGEYASGRYGMAVYNQYGDLVTSSERPPVQNDSGVGVAGCYISLNNVTTGINFDTTIISCTSNTATLASVSGLSVGDVVYWTKKTYSSDTNYRIPDGFPITGIDGNTITTNYYIGSPYEKGHLVKLSRPTGILNVSEGYVVNSSGQYIKVNAQSTPITLGVTTTDDWDGFVWYVVYIDNSGTINYTSVGTSGNYGDIEFIGGEPVLQLQGLPDTSSINGVIIGAILSGIPKENNIYFPNIQHVHQVFHDQNIRQQIPHYVNDSNQLCASNTAYAQWYSSITINAKQNYVITIPIGINKKSVLFCVTPSWNQPSSYGFIGISGRKNYTKGSAQYFFGLSPNTIYGGGYNTNYDSTNNLTDFYAVDGGNVVISDAYITDNSSGQVLKVILYNKYTSSVTKSIFINIHAF